jgi:hypothetical protein
MSDDLSASIVNFISKLLPLYVQEQYNGKLCARSLRDGTLVCPVNEPPENEDGRVEVIWNYDPKRATIANGVFVAQLAISDYVSFHCRSNGQQFDGYLQHLSEHFKLKTGVPLEFDDQSGLLQLIRWMNKLVGKLGAQAAIEALKRVVGV